MVCICSVVHKTQCDHDRAWLCILRWCCIRSGSDITPIPSDSRQIMLLHDISDIFLEAAKLCRWVEAAGTLKHEASD